MLGRITDLWPGLLSRNGQDEYEEGHCSQTEDNLEGSENEARQLDEEQLLEDYRHLYWTRLMVLEGYETGQERKWPLGPDVVEECQAVEQLPEARQHEWEPLFEPADFNEQHGPLELDRYRLTSAEMEAWAVKAI